MDGWYSVVIRRGIRQPYWLAFIRVQDKPYAPGLMVAYAETREKLITKIEWWEWV